MPIAQSCSRDRISTGAVRMKTRSKVAIEIGVSIHLLDVKKCNPNSDKIQPKGLQSQPGAPVQRPKNRIRTRDPFEFGKQSVTRYLNPRPYSLMEDFLHLQR